MKTVLRVSLVLNLVLLGSLLFWMAAAHKADTGATAAHEPRPVKMAATPPSPPMETKPFHWNQLLNMNDYRGFVANLRAVGCPEPTVCAIVMADTDLAFSIKRQQLNLDGSGTGPWSHPAEQQMIAYLLGETNTACLAKASAPEPHLNRNATTLAYPLVFQKVDADALGLKDDQKAIIAEIQQQFIAEIGGSNQDATDPAYLARWQKAQPKTDTLLRGWLGGRAFMFYQLEAQRNAQAQENP